MEYTLVLLVFGLVFSQITAKVTAAATPADASKLAADVAKAATDSVTNTAASGQAMTADALNTAAGAVTDPAGSMNALTSKAMGGLDVSKMTGMLTPLTTMAQQMATNNWDATELAVLGSIDAMNKGMSTMADTAKSVPVVGPMLSPFFGIGSSMASMPRDGLGSIFTFGRTGLNNLWSAFGAPPSNSGNKNSFNPEISNGKGLGSLFSMPSMPSIPSIPGLPSASATASTPSTASPVPST